MAHIPCQHISRQKIEENLNQKIELVSDQSVPCRNMGHSCPGVERHASHVWPWCLFLPGTKPEHAARQVVLDSLHSCAAVEWWCTEI